MQEACIFCDKKRCLHVLFTNKDAPLSKFNVSVAKKYGDNVGLFSNEKKETSGKMPEDV